eukprot:3995971-Pleurochrysis_carterae.AAC.3
MAVVMPQHPHLSTAEREESIASCGGASRRAFGWPGPLRREHSQSQSAPLKLRSALLQVVSVFGSWGRELAERQSME